MQELRVKSGTWSAKGNFTAKTAYGQTFFVHQNLMKELGYSPDDKVSFPFYAVVGTQLIGQLDKNGNPLTDDDGVAVKVERTEALSVFSTLEDLTACAIEEQTIGAEIKLGVQKHISAKASSAGLSQNAVNALVNATI